MVPGLVPVKLSNGESVLKGQTVTSFSNSEEDAVQLSAAMPFMLETRLKEMGATYSSAALFQPHVCVSVGRAFCDCNTFFAYVQICLEC